MVETRFLRCSYRLLLCICIPLPLLSLAANKLDFCDIYTKLKKLKEYKHMWKEFYKWLSTQILQLWLYLLHTESQLPNYLLLAHHWQVPGPNLPSRHYNKTAWINSWTNSMWNLTTTMAIPDSHFDQQRTVAHYQIVQWEIRQTNVCA